MPDYNFYRYSYCGSMVSEADFKRLAQRADSRIRRYERSCEVTYNEDTANSRNMAVCAIVDELYMTASASGLNGEGAVKSVTAGSVSTTYGGVSAETLVSTEGKRIKAALRDYARIYTGVR